MSLRLLSYISTDLQRMMKQDANVADYISQTRSYQQIVPILNFGKFYDTVGEMWIRTFSVGTGLVLSCLGLKRIPRIPNDWVFEIANCDWDPRVSKRHIFIYDKAVWSLLQVPTFLPSNFPDLSGFRHFLSIYFLLKYGLHLSVRVDITNTYILW